MQGHDPSYFNEETKIGQGADGIVYALEDGRVVKFFRQSRYAKKEKCINKFLSETNIYVPKIDELIEMRFPKDHILYNKGNRQWGIIMERIDGKSLLDLNNEEENLAKTTYLTRLEEILGMSLYPQDTGRGHNTLYLGGGDEVAFFDFTKWKTARISKEMKNKILEEGYCHYRANQEGLRY